MTELVGTGKNPGRWQWVRTSFGQTLFIERREQLSVIPDGALPRPRRPSKPAPAHASDARSEPHLPEISAESRSAPDSSRGGSPGRANGALPSNVEDALRVAADAAFDERLIGRLLMHLARQPHGAEKAGIFAGSLARELPDARSEARTV